MELKVFFTGGESAVAGLLAALRVMRGVHVETANRGLDLTFIVGDSHHNSASCHVQLGLEPQISIHGWGHYAESRSVAKSFETLCRRCGLTEQVPETVRRVRSEAA